MAQAAFKTCEICISAPGSQYCLECEQYFCKNCKTFHSRQKISKTHQFQSSLDVIPEGKSKCKDHNEDVSFVCNTCDVAVCSSCVTRSHKRHDFSKLHESISRLKTKNEQELRIKIQEATTNMKQIEEGLIEFDVQVEEAVKSISGEGTKIKAMVDKCVAQMIAAVMDQSKIEWDKSTKLLADTKMDLKEGCDLDKKIYELNKTRNDGKLLKSLQKLTDDIAKLTIESLPVFPCIQYTAKPASDKKIQQLFGIIKISEVRPHQTINREREIRSTKSAYRPDVKPKEHGKYLYRCSRCRWEERSDSYMSP